MAVTYSLPNLGSSSNGGFGIYAVTTTGAEAISVLKADFATNTVSAVTGAVPLTALQTAGLSTLLAKLRTALPSGDPLALLRKLAGVLSTENGVTLTLSVSTAGTEHTLLATTSAAAGVLVYIPNSAAAGLFTGSGADVSAVTVPTTQRYDAIANVPGLFLGGVVCMAVPNAATSGTVITLDATKTAGYAENSATAQKDFRVEKINMAAADPGPGLGTLLFNVRFAATGSGATNQQATVTSVAGDLTVPAGWLYRVVNPAVADTTLADVSITVGATIPL
jgi:hypothetical protein